MFTRYLLLAAKALDKGPLSPLKRAAAIITDYNPNQKRGQPDNAGQFVKDPVTGRKAVYGWRNPPAFYSETNTRGHDKHHEIHASEMGLSMREWKIQASKLLNAQPSNKFIDWQDAGYDLFIRFEKSSRRLVVGTSDGEFRTYFKVDPKFGKAILKFEKENKKEI